jgi:hypothetical protein
LIGAGDRINTHRLPSIKQTLFFQALPLCGRGAPLQLALIVLPRPNIVAALFIFIPASSSSSSPSSSYSSSYCVASAASLPSLMILFMAELPYIYA